LGRRDSYTEMGAGEALRQHTAIVDEEHGSWVCKESMACRRVPGSQDRVGGWQMTEPSGW
jgi:streptogramin lyase